ncbi:MAG: hypothetical protein IT381_33525 [Deltaproteobacteria bacterium]|nr:hypothetical protein [Deltaproteobacteria bacterium]
MKARVLLAVLLAVVVPFEAQSAKKVSGVKDTKFFNVDFDKLQVVKSAAQVATALALNLTSATTDQPQYWPNEKVFLKVIALGQGGTKMTAKLAKKDASSKDIPLTLDAQGVAVLEIMSGEKQKLELGEYRVDVASADGKFKDGATFSVVEGTLGAVSFAHEFKKVTSADELDKTKGAWFLGNAAGAGKRWGNGLNFKNELRIDNKPYTGEADIHSRCMLPGCNGTYAGKSLVHFKVENGQIFGTLDVGGHSGPFQIEVITPKGSLRHQFEGSSHVERDMIPVSGGVTYLHRAGLAPYDKTEQVPGRQIFVEKSKGGEDAFSVERIIADRPVNNSGKLTIKTTKKLKGVMLTVARPNGKGGFNEPTLEKKGDLEAGATITVDVAGPYSFIAVGGFHDGRFVEGYAFGFLPTGMNVAIEAPERGGPKSTVTVRVKTSDLAGKALRVSGILEAYDNRVASKSALNPLGSAIGDSVRNASNAIASWRDNTGYDVDDSPHELAESAKDEEQAPSPAKTMPAPPPSAKPANGYGSGSGAMKKMAARSMSGGGARAVVAGGVAGKEEEEEAPQEAIREGEKKVVFCQLVTTDDSGSGAADITLPPQLGRITFRFVAVSGLDFGSAQKDIDSSREAAADLRLPKTFVPGAKLSVPIAVTNSTKGQITVTASGVGIEPPVTKSFGPGNHEMSVAWAPAKNGKVIVSVTNDQKKVVDRREIEVASLQDQPVTYSRLEFLGAGAVNVDKGDTVTVYKSSGELLRGVVMNMFTTMESWFGHAEALSAKVAAQAVIVAAVSRGMLQDDGISQNIIAGVDKTTRDLEQAFFDPASGLVRPYPGLPPNELWSGWVARNLHAATRALAQAKSTDARITQALASTSRMAAAIDAALAKKGIKTDEQFGFDSKGNDVVPVEIDGKVVYRVVTDAAVTKWATEKLLPKLPPHAANAELAFAKAYDVFRFLRAFERTGGLQYLTDVAKGIYQSGNMQAFVPLYRTITRGMILAQEPGMLQGPALLGGVYSTPMAMVRFLELQLLLAEKPATGDAKMDGKAIAYGENRTGGGMLDGPSGAIARVDRKASVRFDVKSEQAFAKISTSKADVKAGGELGFMVELDAAKDPLEYYAIVAVPSTTSVKQTVDILSDYRGQLIYGQQGMGGVQTQVITVPFRGSRKLELLLEGAFAGLSPSMIIVRHIENPMLVSTVVGPEVTVR